MSTSDFRRSLIDTYDFEFDSALQNSKEARRLLRAGTLAGTPEDEAEYQGQMELAVEILADMMEQLMSTVHLPRAQLRAMEQGVIERLLQLSLDGKDLLERLMAGGNVGMDIDDDVYMETEIDGMELGSSGSEVESDGNEEQEEDDDDDENVDEDDEDNEEDGGDEEESEEKGGEGGENDGEEDEDEDEEDEHEVTDDEESNGGETDDKESEDNGILEDEDDDEEETEEWYYNGPDVSDKEYRRKVRRLERYLAYRRIADNLLGHAPAVESDDEESVEAFSGEERSKIKRRKKVRRLSLAPRNVKIPAPVIDDSAEDTEESTTEAGDSEEVNSAN